MYSVMIVEDEVLVCVGLQNMVHWADMEMSIVGCVQNGKQGLELYQKEKPDVILTDLKMPVMDGIEMIREIRKNDTETKIIVLTSYEEYELIRQAFKLGISDYILKLKMMPEDIENVVRKVYQELQEGKQRQKTEAKEETAVNRQEQAIERCRNYLREEAEEDPDEIGAELGLAGMDFRVLEMKILTDENIHGTRQKSEKEMQQMAVNLIQKLLDENNSGVVFWTEENEYVLLLKTNVEDLKQDAPKTGNAETEWLLKLLSRIRTMFMTYMNRNVVFGASHQGTSAKQIKALYEEAVFARKEAVLLEQDLVFWGEADMYEKYISMLDEFEVRLKQMNEIHAHCRNKIEKEAEELKKKTEVPSVDDVRETFVRWIHRISFDDSQHKEEMLKITLKAASRIRTTDSLWAMVEIFEEYVKDIGTARECKMVSTEVAQALKFIEEHYAEDSVSLSSVAHLVGMNKDYFSSLFKKETGCGLVDYVNQKRIDKAKELLRTTNKKSYEIGYEVGFQDESYFSRVFKKMVGVRPNEYKKREL